MKILRKSISLFLIVLALNSNYTFADTQSCENDRKALAELLVACDQANKAYKKVINEQQALLLLKEDAIKLQEKEIKRLQKQSQSFLNSPIFWGLAGALVGTIAAGVLLRR